MRHALAFVFSLVLIGSAIQAADFGEKAPAVSVSEWIGGSGGNPAESDGKTLHVVVFWATWHPQGGPALAESDGLQKDVGKQGVKVLAITNEDKDVVADFLGKAKLTCHIGLDRNGATMKAYGVGRSNVPYAFVIAKDGTVAWHGNPLQGMSVVVHDVLSGTYSVETTKQIRDLQQQMQSARNTEEAVGTLDKIIALDPDNPDYYAMKCMMYMRNRQLQEIPPIYSAWAAGCENNPKGLAALTMFLVRQTDLQLKNPPLALKAASRAYGLTEAKSPEAAYAMARAVADIGLIEKAVMVLDRAVKQGVADDEIKGALQYYTRVRKFQDEVKNMVAGDKPEEQKPDTPAAQ